MKTLFLSIALLLSSTAVAAVPTLERGDVLVSTFAQPTPQSEVTRILVYSPSAVLKGELISSADDLRETLYRNGDVYIATTTGIQRINANGQISAYATFSNPVWLSPAADGRIIAANGSGEIYQVDRQGTPRLMQEARVGYIPAHGLDVAADQCTVYYAGSSRLVIWDVCRNSEPAPFGELRFDPTQAALRLLGDGTFIVTYLSDIFHVDSSGNTIRSYGIPSRGIALDVGGTAFWAGAGSTVFKIDVATGAILARADVPGSPAIQYLGVVGEPRASLLAAQAAAVPALSGWGLALFLSTILVVAILRLR